MRRSPSRVIVAMTLGSSSVAAHVGVVDLGVDLGHLAGPGQLVRLAEGDRGQVVRHPPRIHGQDVAEDDHADLLVGIAEDLR